MKSTITSRNEIIDERHTAAITRPCHYHGLWSGWRHVAASTLVAIDCGMLFATAPYITHVLVPAPGLSRRGPRAADPGESCAGAPGGTL